MITLFDTMLALGILLAMFLSEHPKKAVVAFIVLIHLSITTMDYFLTGWIEYYIASMSESIGAAVIIFCTRFARNATEKAFFWINSAFLLLSASIVPLFKYDIILYHSDYVYLSQMVAFLHLTALLWFADGTRNIVRSTYDLFHSIRGRLSGLGH